MTVQEMIARQRQITDQARSEGRDLTEAEKAEFDRLQRQIDAGDGNRGAATGGQEPPASAPGKEDPDAAGQRAALAERARISEIQGLCRKFGVDPDPFVSRGDSIDQVRAAVLDQLERNGSPVSVRVTTDAGDKKRAAMVDGILLRNNIPVEKPAEGAREFRGTSLRMIAASCLAEEDSENSRNYYMMGANELFEETMRRSFYNPSSAFPAIMDQTIRKAYVEGHKTAPVTFDQFTSRGTLTDFKKADNYYIQGSFGEFLEVPGKRGIKAYASDGRKAAPRDSLRTYGRQFTMSRQAFINDDMGVVTTLPARAARASRTTINNQVYKVLTGSQKIYDGKPLFTAEHKNILAQGTEISQEAVQSMILALGGHKKKMDGVDQAVIIRPAVMVVPLGYKFQMYTLFHSTTISSIRNGKSSLPV